MYSLDDYYLFLKNYHKDNQKFPQQDVIEKETGCDKETIINYNRILERTGRIYRNHSVYRMPKNTAPVTPLPGVLKPPARIPVIDQILIMRIVILLTGIIALILTVNYNYSWYLPLMGAFKAVLLAVCLSAFEVISLEAMILFFKNKNYGLSVFFLIFFVVILIISMGNITAGQFNQFEKSKKQLQIDNINFERRKIIDNELIVIDSQIQLLQKRSDELSDKSNWRFYENQKRLNEMIDKRSGLNKEKIEVIENGSTEIKDFFTFLSEITGIDKTIIQFIFQLLPALFLDSISSISFSLVLFMKRGVK